MANLENETFYTRTEMMLGKDALEKLKAAHVIIFGVGGVGGFCMEALARAGVGELTLVDSDCVAVSNINRQIIATTDSVGKLKVEVGKERILSINPDCKVHTKPIFYNAETESEFDFSNYTYVVDAIDSLRAKIHLIKSVKAKDIPIISAMGAGNKLDPTRFQVSDISKTKVDPIARILRSELKKAGIKKLKVVYSEEEPVHQGGRTPGSISFVPSVVGLIMAGEVIKDIGEVRKDS